VPSVASLAGDVMSSVEQKCSSNSSASNWAAAEAKFEPSEEIISQLTDMGFSREHELDALESTRTNRIDIAMESVLTISTPPPAN
jgi:uncharacterized UBP type Zn finger protein